AIFLPKSQILNEERIYIPVEKSTKTLSLFYAYWLCTWINGSVATILVDSQFEQKKYVKRAQKWLIKAETLLPKINSNSSFALFYYIRFNYAILSIYLGSFASDIKHVMEYINLWTNYIPLYFPRIVIVTEVFFASIIFVLGALNRSTPNLLRIDFAKRALNLLELITTKIPIVSNPEYKMLNMLRKAELCTINTILGDSIKESNDKFNHIQMASKIYSEIYYFRKQEKTGYFNLLYSILISRTGILLAKNSSKISEKVKYYQTAIDLLSKTKRMPVALFHIENLFLIGDIYYEVGRLTKDEDFLKKSYIAYVDTIEYCKNRGYFNLVGSAYVNLARIEDRLGNFLSAAENYQKSIDAFDKAVLTLTYTKISKKIVKLKNYMTAWKLIEIAKSYHTKEEDYNAQLHYEKASQILKNIRAYKYESPFYTAWATLENAEQLSKENKHQEAAELYEISKDNFNEAIEILNSYLTKRNPLEDFERISKLIQVAKIRAVYCTARNHIEIARSESKIGNHIPASKLYNKASSLFENLCQSFQIQREKNELTATFYLCKAWENMELAEIEQKSSLYALASDLFKKAGNFFPENRMKKLAFGNSLYCSALEYGSKFDKSTEIEEKLDYYKKIKMYLRDSSKNYQLGGFKQDAQWVFATSNFFDGMWYLIQSDTEVDFSKRNQYLNIAIQYHNKAMVIFEKAGYTQKKEEILNYLELINNERAILTSALNIIEKPAISASSIGISAPSCPLEISSSVDIEEMQQTDLQAESEKNWQKRIQHLYLFMPNGVCIHDQPFKSEINLDRQLVSTGLTGISMFIQELTKKMTKVKIVEQEDVTILFDHGKYISGALITEENLITLRTKLKQLIQEVESFYQKDLENFVGNLDKFSNMGKLVQNIFGN
ncbi:MAG: hypothetical protein ACFFD2_26275, partial [Promethearchaeota archaeon]